VAVEPSRNPCHLIGLATQVCVAVEPSRKGEQACTVHRLEDYLRVPRHLAGLATQCRMAHSRVPLHSIATAGPSRKGMQACVVHLPVPLRRLNIMKGVVTRVLPTEERRRGLSHGPLPSRSVGITTFGEMGIVLPLLIVYIDRGSCVMTFVVHIIATMMKRSSRSQPTNMTFNQCKVRVGNKHVHLAQDRVLSGVGPLTPDVRPRPSTIQ
jgi:hypothetical protein